MFSIHNVGIFQSYFELKSPFHFTKNVVLWISSHQLKKSLMKNLFICVVFFMFSEPDFSAAMVKTNVMIHEFTKSRLENEFNYFMTEVLHSFA